MKKIILFSIFLFIAKLNCIGDTPTNNFIHPVTLEMAEEEIHPDPIQRKSQLNRSIIRLRNESRKFDKNRIFVGIIFMVSGISVAMGSGFDTPLEQISSLTLMIGGYKLFRNGLDNKPKRDELDHVIRERAYLQAQQELVEQV
ncbi:hypothetical protein M1446_01725 [Candidatus Dependentiae bacterium]|nr:hypothetical protein [Candidatus Dependentiae bacterium]